jgi:hypothetical protein
LWRRPDDLSDLALTPRVARVIADAHKLLERGR